MKIYYEDICGDDYITNCSESVGININRINNILEQRSNNIFEELLTRLKDKELPITIETVKEVLDEQ